MENEGQETIQPKKSDDGFVAIVILVIASVVGIYLLVNYWRSTKNTRMALQASGGFSPPPERAAYLEAKESLDRSNPSELDELKKLLMKRALKAIPIVLSLQNEGSSIERLYKKGMLTDDMHFKVKELKAFVDEEFQEVQNEAEMLLEGWGQMIWPQAMQFHQMIQKQGDNKTGETEEKDEGKKNTNTKEPTKAKKEVKQSTPKEVKSKESLPTSDEAKAKEAERNARLLLEEEEREKMNKAKKSGKGGKTGKK